MRGDVRTTSLTSSGVAVISISADADISAGFGRGALSFGVFSMESGVGYGITTTVVLLFISYQIIGNGAISTPETGNCTNLVFSDDKRRKSNQHYEVEV